MNSLIAWLGNSNGYMPHGHCYLWQPSVLWLHVIANTMIAAAYFAIPLILYVFARRRRRELPYWWMPVLFAAFIFLCGLTHVSNVWVIWNPDYRVDGLLKLATGIVSVVTAISLATITPKVLQLQTPAQLQQQVEERTAELTRSNAQLRAALEENERVTAALRRSETRYRHATDALRGYVYEMDLATGTARPSRGFETLLGHGVDGGITIDWWRERVHPDDRARVAATWRSARESGRDSASCKYRLQAHDGRYVWVWDHALFVRNAAGLPEQVIGNVLDVTEQEAARIEAAESEARFRQIADAMPDIVFVTDPRGVVEYINPRWEEKTGRTADPDSARAAVVPEDWPALAGAWVAARARGTQLSHEFRMTDSRTGESRWFVMRAVPVRAADGSIRRWVGSTTDIHAQKRAQEVLADADARKNEFLATLAHELRNPLAPIRYSIRLLQPGTPPDVAENARQMIARQLGHMARLLDDLLDVSRITQGRLELRTEIVDLRDVVRGATDTARPLLASVDHTVTLTLPEKAVPVRGDVTRLTQVLGNLLNNAGRYTDPGGRIDVELASDGGRATVRVRDDGIGISPEAIARIFELFTQVDRSTRAQAGMGIGLALSRRIVELHGGTLTAASAGAGRGSEFVVSLPAMAEEGAPAVRPGGPVPPALPAGIRVLVVDDNVDAAESLSLVLSQRGFATRAVNDGLAATEVAELLRPQVVLLDIGLPKLDGHEVARWIRSRPWGLHTRLIAVTGWGQEDDRRRSLEAGFDLHVTKPVDSEELIAAIERLLAPARKAPR